MSFVFSRVQPPVYKMFLDVLVSAADVSESWPQVALVLLLMSGRLRT